MWLLQRRTKVCNKFDFTSNTIAGEQREGGVCRGGAHRVALTCSKKQNPSLACKLELGNNFSLDLAAQPVCNILCCIVAASAPSCPKSSHPPPRPGCHIAATSYVWLMCRQAGKGWHRKRIQRAANVASQCYVPSRPDRKSCASFSKVPFTLPLTPLHTHKHTQLCLLEVT